MSRSLHRNQAANAIVSGALLVALFSSGVATRAQDDPQKIISRSVEAINADWMAEPNYECVEKDTFKHRMETFDDKMIEGSPYQVLTAVNGTPLSPREQREQKKKLAKVTADRKDESPSRKAARIARYESDRRRDHLLITQLAKAFDFKLVAKQELQGHMVYVLQATPKPGYRPPNIQTKVLTGMQGKLWIDEASFQWVKAEATAIHPVAIDGFFAKVEPGTSFELEKSPVGDNIWLPQHFAVHAEAKVLSLFPKDTSEEETYSGCKKSAATDVTLSAK